MNYLKIILFTTLISFVITGCKKYPEDEHISLRRPEHRILGSWQIAKYEVDGIDSTAFFQSKYGYSYLVFVKGTTGSYQTYFFTKACKTCDSVFVSSWTISRPKRNTLDASPIGSKYADWTILKLTKNEMKLTYNHPVTYNIWFTK